MKLSELNLQHTWNTDQDDVLNDFYIKALSSTKNYDRTTYTFSSSLLAVAARGLDGLIESDGEMRLIIGDEIQASDYDAIVEGDKLQKLQDQCLAKLKLLLANADDNNLYKHRSEILQYLIGAKKLEIKFALIKAGKGIFHPKTGIMYGHDDEIVVFKGSGNETRSGMDLNWESFDAFFSWEEQPFKLYANSSIIEFNKLWDFGGSKKINLITLPNEDLLEVFPKNKKTISTIRLKPKKFESKLAGEELEVLIPEIPKLINGNAFDARPYQKTALNDWKDSNFKGILEHATGSGKTLTAIYGVAKIFEQSKGPVITIVGVPYTILAEQWAEEFKLFNVIPILCFGDSNKWFSNVQNRINSASSSNKKQLIVLIVVNASLMGRKFSEVNELIKKKNLKSIFIGDECHEYAGRDIEKLPNSERKLGLSATPFKEDESLKTLTRNNNLKNYFGDVVNSFSLQDALDQDFLCPYEYHPIFIHLSHEEEAEYLELSRKIAATYNSENDGTADDTMSNILLGKRARLIGSADEKFIKLKTLAKKLDKPHNTLIFTGDGKNETLEEEEIKDKHRVIQILKGLKWDVAEFTADVDELTRKIRIQDFIDNTLNGLVAIKVLDQGVNIPAIQTAIILASTRSRRQYIQRLGRVLRKSENKDLSHIYDFIVLPSKQNLSELSDSLIRLIDEERKRFDEFSKCCKNSDSLKNEFEKHVQLINE